ncbi:RIP metalloprotease RseP [Accumulibacter sp.]|uniref:RIP metalloprotease RseP n=1 Tax=Accumulibacter sp. TaxID=2053492 RepID=UPI00287B265C|nr:RIP metalloprotease RseP [Accumulibacter sp.]MDS4053436.1 RIP metalloprotease RseP [Accumulibacter sp.]HMW79473.1 RIP metalloprotease RseP [Accumulibacter sp.]HMX68318.1 RIP metalloprotease RseP [Accumulibacter sp.]HNE38769.1 RIP metalloprotease RseP [Accumulibacter sp.]HNG14623.1 RIP metalloprotease RseP [Accumulibacter sp.]
MSTFIHYLVAFAIALAVLVVVHELGHFLVARWVGVKVLRFSVGFGQPLWRRRFGRDGTEWVIAAFPLGGYVKMVDEREGSVAVEDLPRSFNRRPVGQRMAIVAAGPVANLVLATLIYWGLFWHGTEEFRPLLAAPPAMSAAAAAGIEDGELVRKVDGAPVRSWQELRWMLLRDAAESDSVELEVINGRQEIAIRRLSLSAVRESGWDGEAFDRLGLGLHRPSLPPVLAKVMRNSAAAAAGLLPGDEITAIDGLEIRTWADIVAAVRAAPGRALTVDLQRSGQSMRMTVTPAAVDERGREVGRIGVAAIDDARARADMTTVVSHPPLPALAKALRETWEKSAFTLRMIGKMIVGEVSWRNISGPVTIADYAGQSAQLGVDYYLKFLALISISLGVLNLLPIPILDGGHLLYYLIEIIKRGPVSERTMEVGQRVGLALLLMLMAFAFYNDINRLFSG